MLTKHNFIYLLAFTFICVNSAYGQITYGTYTDWNTQRSVNMQSIITNNAINSVMINGATKGSRKSATNQSRGNSAGTQGKSVNQPNLSGSTTFKPSGSRLMVTEIAKATINKKSELKDREDYLTGGLEAYEKILVDKGFSPNDVARSTTSLIINCLMVNRGLTPSEVQRKGIYQQVKNAFLSDKSFSTKSDADKQRAYETAALFWVMLSSADVNIKKENDPKRTAAVKNMAADIFQTFTNGSIDNVRVDANGLNW